VPAAGVPGVEVERRSRPPWSAGTGRRAATSMRRRSALTESRASVRTQHPCALLPQGLARHSHKVVMLRAVLASQSMARMPGTSSRMSVRASMRASQRGASRMHHGRRDGGPDHRVCLPRQCFMAVFRHVSFSMSLHAPGGACMHQRSAQEFSTRPNIRDAAHTLAKQTSARSAAARHLRRCSTRMARTARPSRCWASRRCRRRTARCPN